MKKLKTEEQLARELKSIKAHLEKVILSPNIERTVHLLMVYGFVTTKSSEGYLPAVSHVDMNRPFAPYVQVNLSKEIVVFNNGVVSELERHCVSTEKGIRLLLTEFNEARHPYASAGSELNLIFEEELGCTPNRANLERLKEENDNVLGFIVDNAVRGPWSAHQHVTGERSRKLLFDRTQSQMGLFTDFLHWKLFTN